MLVKLGAALATLTALVHIFIGGYDTLLPLLSSSLDPEVLGAFHACWHMVGLVLAYSAWRFWLGGQIARHMAVLWIAFAVIFVCVGLWQAGLGGLLLLPQWILLGPAGALVLLGSRRNQQEAPLA
ncbi:MAG: hypothetical protein Kilf2KO_41180 [Rhodospirillales bacterium]